VEKCVNVCRRMKPRLAARIQNYSEIPAPTDEDTERLTSLLALHDQLESSLSQMVAVPSSDPSLPAPASRIVIRTADNAQHDKSRRLPVTTNTNTPSHPQKRPDNEPIPALPPPTKGSANIQQRDSGEDHSHTRVANLLEEKEGDLFDVEESTQDVPELLDDLLAMDRYEDAEAQQQQQQQEQHEGGSAAVSVPENRILYQSAACMVVDVATGKKPSPPEHETTDLLGFDDPHQRQQQQPETPPREGEREADDWAQFDDGERVAAIASNPFIVTPPSDKVTPPTPPQAVPRLAPPPAAKVSVSPVKPTTHTTTTNLLEEVDPEPEHHVGKAFDGLFETGVADGSGATANTPRDPAAAAADEQHHHLAPAPHLASRSVRDITLIPSDGDSLGAPLPPFPSPFDDEGPHNDDFAAFDAAQGSGWPEQRGNEGGGEREGGGESRQQQQQVDRPASAPSLVPHLPPPRRARDVGVVPTPSSERDKGKDLLDL